MVSLPRFRPALLALVALLGLTACETALGPQAGAIGLQSNALTQGNAEQAQTALSKAMEQTCAAAGPYQQAAQTAATAAQSKADQAQDLADEIQAGIGFQATANGFLSQLNAINDSEREQTDAAADALSSLFGLPAYNAAGVQVGIDFGKFKQDTLVETAIERTTDAFNAHLRRAHAMYSEAVKLQDSLATPEVQAFLASQNPGFDVNQAVADLVAGYDSYMQEAGALLGETIHINTDVGFVSQLTDSDRRDLQKWSLAVKSLGPLYGTRDTWRTLRDWIGGNSQGVIGQYNIMFNSNARDLRVLADDSHTDSAEATRNAWLAIEACGGTIPPDVGPLDSPFGSVPGPYPSRNDTFWDISSP
ncbi:MAG: hypothetical protein KDE22_14035 [Rhodobacterales bacterium]|nr:hypothetical protein [Rhodobacterales bacterium]